MPAMADITVKKADLTTDIVYNALTASGGDTGTARWRQDTGAVSGLPAEHRASLFLRTIEHDNGRSRKGIATYRRPAYYQDTTTGLYKADLAGSGRAELIIPKGMTPADQAEFVYQFCHLMAALLMKQSLAAGYAP